METKNNTLSKVTSEKEHALQDAMDELDIYDRNSILYFGSSAQKKIDEISSRMLEGVKHKELGSIGEALHQMISSIEGFDMEKFNPNKKSTWWQKVLGTTRPLVKFIEKYEEVQGQIEYISHSLEGHKRQLMQDIVSLNRLYDTNLDYLKKLEHYIKAGERKCEEIEYTILPAYETQASHEEVGTLESLNDIRTFKDELEQRIHDLRLSRQVTLQALPNIRLIQKNDQALISKITSTLLNTVPLWRNQLAQTITIFRSYKSTKALQDVSSLNNHLLEQNAITLQTTTQEINKEMQRGLFDIESIKKANALFIRTLHDSLEITQEGKREREEAVVALHESEAKLKSTLLSLGSLTLKHRDG